MTEAGFTESGSADMLIDDEYQLEKFQKAVTPRERLVAAMGYFLKVSKHGYAAVTEYGDAEIARRLDEVCEDAARQLVIATQCAKSHLGRFDPSY